MQKNKSRPTDSADSCAHYHAAHDHAHAKACDCEHDHAHPHAHDCGHDHAAHTHAHDCGHDHAAHTHAHDCGHNHAASTHACGCGHDHAASTHGEHDQAHTCDCGHDHAAHDGRSAHTTTPPSVGNQHIYLLENLSCAHCASQMEQAVAALPEVQSCVLVFETRQLRVTAKHPEALLPIIRTVCTQIEPAVRVFAPGETDIPERSPLPSLITGAACFVIGLLLPIPIGKIGFLLAAYLILGWQVLWTAVRNLFRGRVFDENFLMSLATIGAVAIGEYAEAVGVMLFYRIGEYFESLAVARSRKQIMSAVDLRPEVVQRLEGDMVHEIPAAQAQIGDRLVVRPGDRIPLDSVVLQGESRIDTSAITGEPVPIRATAGTALLSGGLNTDGRLVVEVTRPLAQSMVQRILDSVENAAARKPTIDRFITRFSRVYTPAVVVLAALTVLVPGAVTGQWSKWLYTALTFLVLSCPCALVLSVPLSYFAGIGAASKRGILFKGGASLEALAHVKDVVMDKTGTITQGNFVVQQVLPADGCTEQHLLALAYACEAHSTHPIARSIAAAAQAQSLTPPTLSEVHEQAGHGVLAQAQGQTVLCGSRRLLEQHGISLAQCPAATDQTEVLLAMAGRYLGLLRIGDTLKADAVQAVEQMKQLGLTTAMLTGDNAQTAHAVAHTVGIDQVRAQLLPDQKLEALTALRATYGAALYVGDGINDAPVLAGADVGGAMGSGADAAIEVADVVFMNTDLRSVPQSVRLARFTERLAKQNIVFALTIKVLVMLLGLRGIASMWLAVFADSGVALLCVLNSMRVLYQKD